jgi:hypothetical protein
MRWFWFFLFSLACHGVSMAARPFVTDDARLTNEGQCQLESWTRRYSNSTESWALPACNPFGNFELSLGTGVAHDTQGVRTQDYIVQGKTLVRKLSTDDWGWGVAVGHIMHPAVNPGPNLMGNTYAYLPISRSFRQDDIIMHLNVGWLKDKATGQNKTTWGIGSELKLGSRLLGIAEAFGDSTASPYFQTGFRFAVRPDLFQVDMTIGKQHHGTGESRWLSFGIRYTP